uniref:Ribonucleoside-diphosphate reductase n=1 Tax=Clandestinovirus TaxID=2831644 RepID=A0A8F8PM95_9VIRU|nr:ribonucleoside--diphosphate reductase large subunit [Clandestinovirus]
MTTLPYSIINRSQSSHGDPIINSGTEVRIESNKVTDQQQDDMNGNKLASPNSPAIGEDLYVIKRNGQRQEVKFDKITLRLKKLANEGRHLNVDVVKVAQKVIDGIFAGVTTSELDKFAAKIAAQMTSVHPDYAELAGRVLASDVHKNMPKTFSAAMEMAYSENWNKYTKVYSPMVNDKFIAFVRLHAEILDAAIDLQYDYTYNAFSSATIHKSYTMKTQQQKLIETFQYTLMRVAIGTSNYDLARALKTYEYLKKKYATHATPTIFNAGTNREQLSSCFLHALKSDSIEGIYETLKNCALLSKNAGGIGLSIHNIRASNSYIRGTNGTSNGLVPMLRVFNDTAKYVDQCFKEDTFVVTGRGIIPVSQVIVGDTVYTSNNTFERVISVRKYNLPVVTQEDKNTLLSSFTIATSPLPTVCTEMHPFLVLRKAGNMLAEDDPTTLEKLMDMELLVADWIEAQNLMKGDLVAVPLMGKVNESMPSIEACRQLGAELDRSSSELVLPSEYINLDEDHTVAFLEGLCANKSIEEVDQCYWIDNCTYPFAYALAIQMLRLGYLPTYKNTRQFTVSVGVPKLATMGVTGYQVVRRNDIAWVPITNIEPVTAESCATSTENGDAVVVYDFDVENHHEYLTQGGLAHNGGGKRKGAFAMYLEPWHADIEDFLQQRKGKKTVSIGDDGLTSPDLFYGLWVPDLFMERVESEGTWSLFCPDEAPGLYDCWGDEFKAKYEAYEKAGLARKTMKAQDLWDQIVNSQIESGTPYMLYKDAANRKSNQQHLGTIRSSNLCTVST